MTTYARYQSFVQDELGNIQPNATVEVRSETDNSLATLYADLSGATPLANPIYSDSSGLFYFHATAGQYKVTVTKGSLTQTFRYVQVGVAAGADGTTPGIKQTFSSSTGDADPGNGLFRLNHATLASVTAIYLDNLDASGANVSAFIDTFDDTGDSTNRGYIELRCVADNSIFAIYRITGSVADGTGYRKLTAVHVASNGSFTGAFVMAFTRSGASGTSGITPAVKQTYDGANYTDVDPGNGTFRLNNATLASATAGYFDNLDADGATVSGWLDTLDDDGASGGRGTLTLRQVSDATKFAKYKVTGSVVDGTGYRKLTLTHLASNGPLSGTCAIDFSATGATGASGAGTGDVVGPAGAVDSRIAVYDGTSGKLLKDGGYTIASLMSQVLSDVRNGVSAAFDTLAEIATDLAGKLAASNNLSDVANAATARTNLGLGTGNTPQFTGVEVGHATDTTLSRFSAGVVAVEGNQLKMAGKEAFWIPAAAMRANTTNGPSSGSVETTTNKNMLVTLDFDTTTQESAQFAVRMPKSWNEGTITAAFTWSHASTSTNFGVVWDIAAVAYSDGDAGDAAFGTTQQVADTGGTTNTLYVTSATSAMTVAGSPQAEDWVLFRVRRVPADGSDTMAIDARLQGVTLYVTTDAANDA